jgi:hypothetical protein
MVVIAGGRRLSIDRQLAAVHLVAAPDETVLARACQRLLEDVGSSGDEASRIIAFASTGR